ncbi:MAG: type II secretion system protein [Patescibacteria group bacterium]|nr:type II secretion system protein [Patescibacteria group bacterium]
MEQTKKSQNYFINQKGFTLIELLVVISIIGILSSFAVVSLNNARLKARDAKRKADVVQMRVAISIYYDDHNQYPICGTWSGAEADYGASPEAGSSCYNNTLNAALMSGSKPYMSVLPKDPKNSNNDPAVSNTYLYRYVSTSNGDQFALVYETEDTTDSSPQVVRGW